MMSGFYLITRGITSHPLFKGKPERLAVWMWLMDNVAWQDTTHDVAGKTIRVRRGSVCASERQIAQGCGVGRQVVRTALKRFQDDHMINQDLTHGKAVITLCNYEKHQQPEKSTNPALTHDQPSTNPQKKQGNKGTIEEEDTNVSLSSDDDAKPKPFDEITEAVSAYNIAAERSGWPRVAVLSKARRSALAARLRECGGLSGWAAALAKAQASNHCCGGNDRGWTANFDFLTRQSSFAKLMEGNYDNRAGKHQIPHRRQDRPDPAIDQIARIAGLGAASGNGRS